MRAFYTEYECPYFSDGRQTALNLYKPDIMEMQNYHLLLAKGFRRYGPFFYENACPNCDRCKPLRVKVDQFKMSKSQRRTWKKNRDVTVKIESNPVPTEEKADLYKKYILNKHQREDIKDLLANLINLHTGFTGIVEMDYYLEGKLVAVGIVDDAHNSISTNYVYYDTDFLHRRPGVFTALTELQLAKELKKEYYYMGFYIEECEKMNYKKFFRPNQLYINEEWADFIRE